MAPQSDVSPIQELRIQAQWKEIDKKQQKIKLRWFRKNYEKVYLNPPEQLKPVRKTEQKAEELRKMRKIRFENDKIDRLKFQKKTEALPPYKPDEIIEWKVSDTRGPMRPVPEEIKAELYKGISHNDEGRKRYLKLRNQYNLEEKFYEPITFQHEYGWDVQNRFMPSARYGRKSIIKQSFTKRNGALTMDSCYWREPMSNGPPSYLR